jgi:hypothetical protein
MDCIKILAEFRNLRRLTVDCVTLQADTLYDDGFEQELVQQLRDRKKGVPLEHLSVGLSSSHWGIGPGEFDYSADYDWDMDGRLVKFDEFVSTEESEDDELSSIDGY